MTRPARARLLPAAAVALLAAFALALPAGAWDTGWSKPKRVFAASGAPTHAMDVDAGGKTHIATERGSEGIWYVTNASGAWTKCQLSEGNDREPTIVTEGGVVHIAFARRTPGSEGLYTASSDQLSSAEGCGWALRSRYEGSVSHPSMEVFGGQLSIAFRAAPARLRFVRGPAADSDWGILETIDARCCTSPPALELTTAGAPRVAYGDGKRTAEGLKYAVRTASGWKRSKVAGGRIKQVEMALEKAPGVGTPPPNAPRILFVVARKGTFYAAKGTSGVGGSWFLDWYGKHSAKPDLQVWSNDELLLYGGNGKYWYTVKRAAIRFEYLLTSSGRDVKANLDASTITFGRKKGTTGIYYSRKH